MISNATRAAWAKAAVDFFATMARCDTAWAALAPGNPERAEALTEVIGDLLTDLHHLCRREGLDWPELITNAEAMAATEVSEDPEEDDTNMPPTQEGK